VRNDLENAALGDVIGDVPGRRAWIIPLVRNDLNNASLAT
jgi:hypothetical protein